MERYLKTYEVSERFSLGNICTLIRFIEEPQKLGIEWIDGSAPTFYASTARDAILAAILDVAQLNAGRPVPIITDVSLTGDTIFGSRHAVGSSIPVKPVPELEQLYLRVLSDLGKTVHPAIHSIQSGDLRPYESMSTVDSMLTISSDNEEPGPMVPEASRPSFTKYTPMTDCMSHGLFRSMTRRKKGSVGVNTQEVRLVIFDCASTVMAVQLKARMLLRVREFNACIPYEGVSKGATLPEMSVHSIYSLLPDPAPENAPPPGITVATHVGTRLGYVM